MTIAGYVLTQNCKPVGRALVELWHADQTGTYDNSGFNLRGHQFTDAEADGGSIRSCPACIPVAPGTII